MNSKAEQECVYSKMIELGWYADFWRGGSSKDVKVSRNDAASWEWVDNSIFDFTNWQLGEPNNLNGQDKIHMATSDNVIGLWDGIYNTTKRQAIYKRVSRKP